MINPKSEIMNMHLNNIYLLLAKAIIYLQRCSRQHSTPNLDQISGLRNSQPQQKALLACRRSLAAFFVRQALKRASLERATLPVIQWHQEIQLMRIHGAILK